MSQGIQKLLSANDVGTTGSHQAGMLIPKEKLILSYFPILDPDSKNPRCLILFVDRAAETWELSFIYYNNALFGGTRNEYRLTRMTKFFRAHNLSEGDVLEFGRNDSDLRSINIIRKMDRETEGRTILKLRSGWKVINY